MQPSQFQGSHELHVHVPRETTHAPSKHYQALTANGLTSTCKQNPIGPVPSTPPLMIVRCKFKGTMEPSPHSKTTSPHHYCLTNCQIIHPHCKQWSHQLSYRWGFQTLHWQQGCPHMQGSIGMMPVEMPAVTLQAIKQSPNFRGSHELHVHALNVHPPLSKH